MKRWVLLIGVLFVLGVSGCVQSNAPSLPVIAELALSSAPTLNQTAEVTAKAEIQNNYPMDVNDTSFEIILPEGFDIVSGNLSWEGNLTKGKRITLNGIIKAVKTGIWEIKTQMKYGGGYDIVYVWVKNDSAEMSKFPIYEDPGRREAKRFDE